MPSLEPGTNILIFHKNHADGPYSRATVISLDVDTGINWAFTQQGNRVRLVADGSVTSMNGLACYRWRFNNLEYGTAPPLQFDGLNARIRKENKECQHAWEETIGFTSVYIDCRKCGAKK